MTNRDFDIHERIYRFVLAVLRLLKTLPRNSINENFIEQCSRSVTSVGANDQEADACQSKKDFLLKYGIAKKELKETLYWLRLVKDINFGLNKQVENLFGEGKQILLIVSKIIVNTKQRKI